MARRRYSDEDKAAALATLDAMDGNVNGAARKLGIAESTLRSWNNDRGVHPVVANLREKKKGELADRLKEIAHEIIDGMPDKISEASLRDSGVTLGIVLDKLQLLSGAATSRNEHRVSVLDELSDEELLAIINEND